MPWPHESSDLPPDPALQFARLPNGLRFVWQQHAHPPGRCSLRLVVHVGSVDEGDGEHGMAHFVEHMAFNGTKRFPGNTVTEWFRQRGMAGGAHVSAFTSPIDTTYGVELPANDLASVQDGLAVLCDITTGMLFEPAEVEAERGVIDAEERERSSSPLARANPRADAVCSPVGARSNTIRSARQRTALAPRGSQPGRPGTRDE